jgi:hypothetical protein
LPPCFLKNGLSRENTKGHFTGGTIEGA